jgi:hypothetical protein
MKKYFQITIDAYFVFRADLLIEERADNKYTLPDGYEIKLARTPEYEDISSLVDLWKNAYHKKNNVSKEIINRNINKLFNDGDMCFLLYYQDILVGMSWLGFSQAMSRMHFSQCINPDLASIGHHVYIKPDHRGRSLQLVLNAKSKLTALNQNCNYHFVFVGVKNFASINNLMRSSDKYKLIYHTKIDIPFFILNLFPGFDAEIWTECDQ